jgi:hypothetical protein
MKLRLDILVDTAFHLALDEWAVSIPEKSSLAPPAVGSRQEAEGSVASSKKAIHYSPFIIYNSFIFNNIPASNG